MKADIDDSDNTVRTKVLSESSQFYFYHIPPSPFSIIQHMFSVMLHLNKDMHGLAGLSVPALNLRTFLYGPVSLIVLNASRRLTPVLNR